MSTVENNKKKKAPEVNLGPPYSHTHICNHTHANMHTHEYKEGISGFEAIAWVH